jgi:hypothetical protein
MFLWFRWARLTGLPVAGCLVAGLVDLGWVPGCGSARISMSSHRGHHSSGQPSDDTSFDMR